MQGGGGGSRSVSPRLPRERRERERGRAAAAERPSLSPLGKLLVPVQGRPPAAGRAKNTAAAQPAPRGRAEGSARGRCEPVAGQRPPPRWEQDREQGCSAAPARAHPYRQGPRGKGEPRGRGREGPLLPSPPSGPGRTCPQRSAAVGGALTGAAVLSAGHRSGTRSVPSANRRG